MFLQTAATQSKIDFLSVPKPSQVRDIISDIASFARRVYGSGREEH